MARSLRRIKKNRPKIIKRKKKTPYAKSKVPLEIKQDVKTIEEKLGPEWYATRTIASRPPHADLTTSLLTGNALARATINDRTETWDKSKHSKDNYSATGFVYDPNKGHGRHTQAGITVNEERVNDAEDDKGQLDDDLRRALGKESLIHGKAAPKRPTKRQRAIIANLRNTHGDDVRAMMLDHKRNKMQLSEAVLTELIRACDYWPEGSGVDFRVPKKSLWTRGI